MMMQDIDRKLLGRTIGSGQTADVYAYGADRVLKLHRSETDPALIAREFAVSAAAYAAGVPSWRVDAVVSLNGRTGIVGERVSGPSLHQLLKKSEISLPRTLRILVALNVAVCRLERIRMPQLPLRARRKFMSNRPVHHRLTWRYGVCHGDIQLKNVITDETGAPRLIDWGKAYYGPVVSDLLRTNLLLRRTIDADRRDLPASVRRLAGFTHRVWASGKLGLPLFNLGCLAKLQPQPWVLETAIVLA